MQNKASPKQVIKQNNVAFIAMSLITVADFGPSWTLIFPVSIDFLPLDISYRHIKYAVLCGSFSQLAQYLRLTFVIGCTVLRSSWMWKDILFYGYITSKKRPLFDGHLDCFLEYCG